MNERNELTGSEVIEINMNRIYSQAWLEPTENGYKGMSHTVEIAPDGETIRNEVKPTGLEWVWETQTKPTLLERIKRFFLQ